MTLLDALGNGGGGIDALLRQAVAALLGGTQPFVAYPLAGNQVVALTNFAILSGSASLIEGQKNQFDTYNNFEADIDQFGRPPEPRIVIGDTSIVEGNGGTKTVTVVISLTTGSKDPVSVNWATAAGSASAGADFTAASGSVTFAPWETVKTITVVVAGDAAFEPDETFTITLSGASGAPILDPSALVRIVNDDAAPPTVTVVATDASGAEPGSNTITFTLTRGGDSAPAITVDLGWSGTAGSGDRTGTVTAVTFAAGQTTATITITPTDDQLVEGSETVVLTVQAGVGYLVGSPSSATATIVDDDVPPPPTLSVNDVSVTEGDRTNGPTATVTITLSAASSSTITVTVGVVAGGTATAGTDYTGGTAVLLTFSPGQTAKTFSITVRGERTAEADETVLVGLSGVSAGATIADGQGVVTILNDDGTPLLAPASGAGATSALTAAEIDRALADAGDSSVQPIVEDPAPSLGSAAFSDPQAASSALEPGPAPVEGDAGMIDSGAAERPTQVVRLDLDGATDLTYRGPVTIADVDVPAFTAPGAFAGHEAAIVASMLAMLESLFADHDVVFTIDRVPDGVEHAVVYVGGTGAAFRAYGPCWPSPSRSIVATSTSPTCLRLHQQDPDPGSPVRASLGADLAVYVAHEVAHLLGFEHVHTPHADVGERPPGRRRVQAVHARRDRQGRARRPRSPTD